MQIMRQRIVEASLAEAQAVEAAEADGDEDMEQQQQDPGPGPGPMQQDPGEQGCGEQGDGQAAGASLPKQQLEPEDYALAAICAEQWGADFDDVVVHHPQVRAASAICGNQVTRFLDALGGLDLALAAGHGSGQLLGTSRFGCSSTCSRKPFT
jgi:hypothetical protein